MASYTILDIQSIIAPISRQHGVKSVSLFGSYFTGSADKNSDIDLKKDKEPYVPCFRSAVFD